MIRIAVLSLLAFAALAGSAQAQAISYDARNGVTLGDAPWRSAATFSQTVSYDNSAYTEAEEYAAGASRFAACAANGSKSAWVRFNTDVDGQLFLNVDSSATGYDVFYKVYIAPNSIAPGTAAIGQMTDLACFNNNRGEGQPNEQYAFGHRVPGGHVIYVQTMSVCAYREGIFPCDDFERRNAPAGPTSLTFTFDPDDTPDEDGVPNPLDRCPETDGVVNGTPSNGCPDADGDGVTEPGDACPGAPGSDGTGCRVADEDGDGFNSDDPPFDGRDCDDDDPAQHPQAAEVPYNDVDENCDGHDFRDRDKDDHDDQNRSEDCDPDDRRINAAAREKPGNRVDEDCRNGAKPFRSLTNQITPTFTDRDRNAKADGIARVVVHGAFKGLRITVECSRGPCPYGKKTTVVKKKRRTVVVAKDFRKRIAPGTQVIVHLQARKRVGRAVRYRFTKGGRIPDSTLLCSEAGSSKLLKDGRCDGRS